EHVRRVEALAGAEVHDVARLVTNIAESQLLGGRPSHGDTAWIAIEALEPQAGACARVGGGKQSKAAAQIENATALGQVLADLVEEALAKYPEAAPAIAADDPIVVGPDDVKNGRAAHRSVTRPPRRQVCIHGREARLRREARRGDRSRAAATCAGRPRWPWVARAPDRARIPPGVRGCAHPPRRGRNGSRRGSAWVGGDEGAGARAPRPPSRPSPARGPPRPAVGDHGRARRRGAPCRRYTAHRPPPRPWRREERPRARAQPGSRRGTGPGQRPTEKARRSSRARPEVW